MTVIIVELAMMLIFTFENNCTIIDHDESGNVIGLSGVSFLTNPFFNAASKRMED